MCDAPEPVLEMLWEQLDPKEVLADRFGLGDPLAAAEWAMSTVDEVWGITAHSCQRIVMSDANMLFWLSTPAGRLIAKAATRRQRFPRLEAVAGLTRWCSERAPGTCHRA